MTCLSREELARIAIRGTDAQLPPHVAECSTCQEHLTAMLSLIEELSTVHTALERNHSDSRARLLANLPSRQPTARFKASGRFPIIPKFGDLTMTQRFALAGVSLTLFIAAVFFWTLGSTKPLLALDEVAKEVRAAKSYKLKTEITDAGDNQQPKPAQMTGTFYWLAPGSLRMEMKVGEPNREMDMVDIYPADKDGISIDHKSKTYTRQQARRGHVSPFMLLEGLAKFVGEADRSLGNRVINGKETQGFVIDARKIDPDIHSGPVEIWIDADSKLPAEIRLEMTDGPPFVMRMFDFEWNSDLDSALFDPTAPADYTDATPKQPSIDEQIAEIKKGLETYVEFSGGHYPRVKMVYGDVTRDELLKLAGFDRRPTEEQLRSDKYAKIRNATMGFARINAILRDNPDAAYYGRTVEPKDKDEVLLRWKLDNGDYQVVYGDLRSESISAGKLKELEAGN